ncbi:20664_t:CDS:2 [Cetraspora pellucida]|uniref:Amine oxidase n=1 Tax=Cetraspora pellucida TaxID=1433469 RepID=A0A9N9FQG2_9GLOM|nr:20664_t:CDS:2 [Cetraspora pellucida]
MLYDLIVIGGGFAGISTAIGLEKKDSTAKVLVLEASEEIGGRCRNASVGPNNESSAGFGAQYIGIKQTHIYSIAFRLSSLRSNPKVYGHNPWFRTYSEGKWYDTSVETSWNGIQSLDINASWLKKLSLCKTVLLVYALENLINGAYPSLSWGAYWLDKWNVQEWIDAQKLHPWVAELWVMGVRNIMSIDPKDLSLLHFLWYNVTNGGFFNEVAKDTIGGPQEFSVECGMGVLAQRYSKEIRGDILLNFPVVEIKTCTNQELIVRGKNGTTFMARTVAICVTPGVTNQIKFTSFNNTPVISHERANFFNQPIGYIARVIMRYSQRFWHNVSISQNPNANFYGFSTGTNPTLLKTHMEWALDISDPSKKSYALTIFTRTGIFDNVRAMGITGDQYKKEVERQLKEDAVILTQMEMARMASSVEWYEWSENEWIRCGPNTYTRPGILTALGKKLHEPDAEYAPAFVGYVEGAVRSGELVGQQIYAKLHGNDVQSVVVVGKKPNILFAILFGLLWIIVYILEVIINIILRSLNAISPSKHAWQLDWIYPLLYLTVLMIPSPYALFIPQIFTFIIVSQFDNITNFKALDAPEPSPMRLFIHEICTIFYLLVTLWQSSNSNSLKWIIYALNGALLMATYGAVITHEAVHIGISWGFSQYHFQGHHIKFACPKDFDTPYFNESFWKFLPRNWIALAHLLLQSVITQISFSSNAYTQHYGLNRNLTYMIEGLHHAHHVKCLRNLANESVPLNSGIGILDAAGLALFPQLWFKKINPLIPIEIRLINKNNEEH